ncbi:hypothetical protein I4U23_030845 [Adineta vaga]|nr:hypothetical protein I4U23_030845 [Adineta vaga]
MKDGSLSSTNNNTDLNATDSTTAPPHDQQQQQPPSGNTALVPGQTPSGNGVGYNNSSMMPPPHLASKQQPYPNYPQQQGDMYSRTSNTGSTPQYVPQYSQYPAGGAPIMNPRSPAPNSNAYRPSYSSGSPYQNGIATSSSPSSTTSSGKPTSRPQQVSPKRSSSQPTTPPQQQSRYPSPYPSYSNGPVAYKPGGSNGYAPPPPMQPQQQQQQQQQQQLQQQSSWPPQPPQRDTITPGLASSTGDSDSNSSNTSQQPTSYPSSTMTNGPTTASYPQQQQQQQHLPSYNAGNVGDSTNTNNSMNSSGHNYMDQQYSNVPPQNYGYPPQQMHPYGNHPSQMHGPPTNEFRPPPVQSMDDDNNAYRNKSSTGIAADQQQSHHSSILPPASSLSSQAPSVSSSTNGPKSPSGTSMSSYVPDDADSSNSSFPDSPPPSHEKGQQKRKLSSGTSNSHNTPAEVFTKLREMGEESEREERNQFVERLQKLWEEHQIVCRNLPTISKQTIDLYRLYTCVREQNGFQEFSKVAKNRHWRDIAAKLNIPNSSSAAFNVKQKYINLKLFHYECKFDKGGINPEPILAEIDKPQGKRTKTPKKSTSNSGSTANNLNDSTNDNKISSSQVPPQSQSSGLPPPPPPLHQHQHHQQQQQQQTMPGQPMQDPYRGYPPPHGHPHQMGHPQQQQPQYRPMQMPMHPYGTPGNEMQPPYDPSSGGQMMYNSSEMDYQRAGYPTPPGQPPPMMKPPPSNVYGMPPLSQVQQPPGPMAPQHRLPGPYPSVASKSQQQMPPSQQPDYNTSQTSNLVCAPPNQQAPPQSTGPQQTYHYQPQQPMPSSYPPSNYPQQQAPLPPRTSMMGGPPQSHDPYLSQQVPPNQTYPNQTPPNYMYKKPDTSSITDTSNLDNQDSNKGNKLLINQLRASSSNTSMLSTSSPISVLTNSTTATPNSTITPTITLPTTHFPPNSIEATTLPPKIKRKKLTAKDVTPVDPWKLMMSLRGGLLAETTWALDTINIMLSDDQTHTHFRLKQMPGLLQAIVDIYVKCLTLLFDEFQNSPSNIENQQPSLNDLNGSSHLTCTTIKKHEYRQQQQQQPESVIYRVESNSLNRYKRKYNKEQSVVYERVCDEQGIEKKDPTNILELQNTNDLCFINIHFDPLRFDDSFYEKLYYGKLSDEISTNEHVHEPIRKSSNCSFKRIKTSEDEIINDESTTLENSNDYRHRHHSDSVMEISDSNIQFLRRYKRKFEYDEQQSYELYSGICVSSSSLITKYNQTKEFDSCSKSSDQQENVSSLFTYHSLAYDQICARCTCVSSILRNLSFILGNDIELVKCKTLIGLLARLILLRHGVNHNDLSDNQTSLNETVNDDQSKNSDSKSLPSFSWAECVLNIRENTLVTLANIAGTLVLDSFDSDLLYTLIDGLLHWSTCYSGEAIDSLHSSFISAQRLAIEILTKLSVHEMNMDFILATPPFYRIVSLFHVLTDWLIVDEINGGISNWHPPSLTSSTHYYTNYPRPQSHIQREFAIVLLNALVRCDSLAASVIAHIPYAISLLLNFLEDYEMKTNELMARYGPDYIIRLTTQPSNAQHAEQILFTTSDMLKRAATCLLSIVSYTDNIKVMKRYEDRILNLSTSHVIDSNVGRVLTDVLHYCSLHNS